MRDEKLEMAIGKWQLATGNWQLIIEGTRQTGKTTLIRNFGKTVPQFVEIDMKNLRDRIFFEENFSSENFINDLFTYKKAEPQIRTVLFIDDISESPNAVKWLKNLSPPDNIKVIAASASRVSDLETIQLFPLSFYEFLIAMDEKEMAAALTEVPYPPHDFQRLYRMFHLYTLIGGMPEIVMKYSATRELADLAPVYEKIQDIFEDEIDNTTVSLKVRERAKLALQNAFPFAAERISFNHFASTGSGSRESARVLELLEEALLLKLVYPVVDHEGKINPEKTLKRHSPRLHLPDTGLVNYFTAVQKQVFETTDLMRLFDGQIIRHITGQEIIASGNEPAFWIRSKAQSEARVDYLINYEGLSIPVEVKSGEPGRLRSLFQFMDHCNHPFAVRLWDEPIQVRETKTIKGKKFFLLNLPVFLAGRITDYLPGFMRMAVGNSRQ